MARKTYTRKKGNGKKSKRGVVTAKAISDPEMLYDELDKEEKKEHDRIKTSYEKQGDYPFPGSNYGIQDSPMSTKRGTPVQQYEMEQAERQLAGTAFHKMVNQDIKRRNKNRPADDQQSLLTPEYQKRSMMEIMSGRVQVPYGSGATGTKDISMAPDQYAASLRALRRMKNRKKTNK